MANLVKVSALVADRLMFFRRGMTALLQDSHPGWRLAEAGSFDELLMQMRDGDVELMLVELQLPGLGGAGGVRRLRALYPGRHVVVLADDDDRRTVLECLAAGAHGYVLKSATPPQFLTALDAVLSGGVFAPASLTGAPLHAPAAMPPLSPVAPATLPPILTAARPTIAAGPAHLPPLPAALTERQREVFRFLAEGCATKTIARRLDLSVGTVKVHLAAIYRLLGAHSRMEAMAKACGSFVVSPMLSTLADATAGPAVIGSASAGQDLPSGL